MMTPGSQSSDEELLAFYVANRFAGMECYRETFGGGRKEIGTPIGLINHGATCYLNSVLQSLFHLDKFRNIIMTSAEEATGIVKELKRLFAFMSLSVKSALDTRALLAAFGWTRSQAHEQNDIHEFFSVLVDSMSGTTSIHKLFEGVSSGKI